jgi:phosphatidylinositol N-acetylglucosaminyltransferase subunit A
MVCPRFFNDLWSIVDIGARIDVIRAISEAIDIVSKGRHDPLRAHERMRTFYNWENVTERTEKVYEAVMVSKQMDLGEWTRRYCFLLVFSIDKLRRRTLQLDRFAGPIYTIILIVDRLFFVFGMVDAEERC